RYEYYKDIDALNDSLVIEKFCKLKLKTALYFTKELREQCKSLLMEYYGYDLDGMSESECYRNVEPGDRVMVEGMSSHIMGIGWPLRAVFAYVIIIPFQIILSFIEYYVIRHLKAC
ncbi:MAG: hypothetical protein IJ263_07805, partial [Paludibacteraceae bacterium]|nr:hypothetical protein [Paludibacteraceae bacterium]